MKRNIILWLAVFCFLAASGFSKSFFILKIEDEKVYLDITRQDTVSSKILNVFSKPEIIVHPITKKEISVNKKLGTIVLTEVKDDYAIATAPENIKDKLEIGLKVEFISSEPIDTGALAFGEEVIQELGKNRNVFSMGGFFNAMKGTDILFYGGEMTYRYHFLLTYLYYFQISGGYTYGEEKNVNPKFMYSKALLEWRVSNYFSLLTGGRVGVKKDGIGKGGEAGMRIGKLFGTNMVIGGSIIEDFGRSAYLTFNKKISDSWFNITVQVDSFPTDVKSNYRMRIGGVIPLSSTGNNFFMGITGSGRNTDTIGFGGDMGFEFRF